MKETAAAKERKAALAVIGRRYVKFAPYGDNVCSYCGDPADTLDHCPPLMLAYLRGTDWFDVRGLRFYLFPACRECNSSLGQCRKLSLDDRRELLRKKYWRKYWRVVDAADWSEAEVDDLGPNLRSVLNDLPQKRAWVRRRMRFLGAAA